MASAVVRTPPPPDAEARWELSWRIPRRTSLVLGWLSFMPSWLSCFEASGEGGGREICLTVGGGVSDTSSDWVWPHSERSPEE